MAAWKGGSMAIIVSFVSQKSIVMLRRYHKEKDLFKNNAAEGLL